MGEWRWRKCDTELLPEAELTKQTNEITKYFFSEDEGSNFSKETSPKDSIDELNICLNWAEESDLPLNEMILLRRIRRRAVDLKYQKKRQTIIYFFVWKWI